MTGGYDSTAEEVYFYSGAAALARGYNVLCYDGPGQGGALIEDGLLFRPDWETVVAGAILDYVGRRPEVDPMRIALMGMSFGGYLAPRAASGAPTLAACIADPGQYSLLEEARTRLPAPLARQLPNGSPFMLNIIDRLMRLRLRHPTEGWAIRRGLWVHGVERPIDYLRLAAQYTLEGRIERIRCPTLIASAEGDAIGATAGKLYDLLTCPKTFQRFKTSEGAGAHCEAGARGLFNQRVFDWLDAVLGAQTDAVPRAASTFGARSGVENHQEILRVDRLAWRHEDRADHAIARRGQREVSIFMASIVSRRSPALTDCPGLIAMVETAPGIGLAYMGVVALPRLAGAPAATPRRRGWGP